MLFLLYSRRSEKEFRQERVHRLLVPTLFLMVCTQGMYSLMYFAPMDPACLAHYNNNATNSTPSCLTWWGSVGNGNQTSFASKLIGWFTYPSPQQAWFCLYLFVYSQLYAFNFSNWHPKYGDNGPENPTCCGQDNCSILRKPFSLAARLLCCMNVCFQRATNTMEFSNAIKKLLMGSVKLACLPGGLLALIELLLRWAFPDGKFHAFSFLFDWCNNIHFCLIYFLGYAITCGDSLGFADILRKCRWWYLIIGVFCLIIYVAMAVFGPYWWFVNFYPQITSYVLKCIFRGPGEWMFMLGIYAVSRNTFTKNFKILKTLREMAMPFYLLHQQVLVALVSATFWYPYLRSFIVTIIGSTIYTFALAFLVTRLPGPIRYFFGLPSNHWLIPGGRLSGFIPLIILCILLIIQCVVANILRVTMD